MSLLDVVFPQWLILSCFAIGFLALVTYLAPIIYQSLVYTKQNFAEKYGAEWAIVTGGSSGIGLAMVERMAQQGINTVIVALDDVHLKSSMTELPKKYPQVQFKSLAVNLGSSDYETYLGPVRDLLKQLPNARILFNNAGFILPGIFNKIDLKRQLVNLNCNATAAVCLTHVFLDHLNELDKNAVSGKRGFIGFTSSSAGFLPTPISSMYGATKTFMTSFASAVATEVTEDGIDICCVHPSPISSNFYENARGIGLLTVFEKTALSPFVIVDTFLKAAGRCIIRDQGYFSIGSKLLLKAIDWNFMSELAPLFMKSNPDFRRLKDQQSLKVAQSTSIKEE